MIKRNITANIVGRAWGFISVYLFVPLYLHVLGAEAYGLVGFYSTLLGVMAFADMGFSATLNREMARLSASANAAQERCDLLRTYELSYLVICCVIAVALWLGAPLITEHWLQASTLRSDDITLAIRLMGVAIAFQLPSGLYIGGLMGLQQQVRANFLQIAWSAYRGFGTLLVLWLFSPTIVTFAVWQLVANAIYCLTVRHGLWHALRTDGVRGVGFFRKQVFHNTWRYASGMAGMALLSILLTQIDKLTVSKMLSLEMLGFYTLAGTLASVPLILASPIASAIFPRFTELVARNEPEQLIALYHRTCQFVAIVTVPGCLVVALFSQDVIYLWTGSAASAQAAALAASLLLGGQVLQALTVVPYYLALAHGNIRLNLQVGMVSVVVVTPMMIYLVLHHGLAGAGLSWLIMNLCTMPPYMYFLHRNFLPGQFGRWFRESLALPVLASLPCLMLGYWCLSTIDGRWLRLLLIAVTAVLSIGCSALCAPDIRRWLDNTKFARRLRH